MENTYRIGTVSICTSICRLDSGKAVLGGNVQDLLVRKKKKLLVFEIGNFNLGVRYKKRKLRRNMCLCFL